MNAAGPDSALYTPPKSLYEVFTTINLNLLGVGCGDLVFSSAMIWVVLCALTITHYADDAPTPVPLSPASASAAASAASSNSPSALTLTLNASPLSASPSASCSPLSDSPSNAVSPAALTPSPASLGGSPLSSTASSLSATPNHSAASHVQYSRSWRALGMALLKRWVWVVVVLFGAFPSLPPPFLTPAFVCSCSLLGFGNRLMRLGLSQIAARTHYTLDILVAGYTVPLLWVACLKYAPTQRPPKSQSQSQSD